MFCRVVDSYSLIFVDSFDVGGLEECLNGTFVDIIILPAGNGGGSGDGNGGCRICCAMLRAV